MSVPSFGDFLAEDRRLVILRALAVASQYQANEYLLRRYLERVGHAVSVDLLRTDLAWLAEQGLLRTAAPEGVMVATANDRGLDVAAGRTVVPGVARPQPGM